MLLGPLHQPLQPETPSRHATRSPIERHRERVLCRIPSPLRTSDGISEKVRSATALGTRRKWNSGCDSHQRMPRLKGFAMFARICLVATTSIMLTCATTVHSQSISGQTRLRARLPFSGADCPASTQSAVKSQPRPSTIGGWSSRSPWSYSSLYSAAVYQPVAPWQPPSSSIAPLRPFMEEYSWMDRWENEQAANDASTRGIFNAMMTRPNVQPGFTHSASQSNAYPVNFGPNPPIAQPNPATAAGVPVNSTPSPPLSVPSAATSAPIPY